MRKRPKISRVSKRKTEYLNIGELEYDGRTFNLHVAIHLPPIFRAVKNVAPMMRKNNLNVGVMVSLQMTRQPRELNGVWACPRFRVKHSLPPGNRKETPN